MNKKQKERAKILDRKIKSKIAKAKLIAKTKGECKQLHELGIPCDGCAKGRRAC